MVSFMVQVQSLLVHVLLFERAEKNKAENTGKTFDKLITHYRLLIIPWEFFKALKFK